VVFLPENQLKPAKQAQDEIQFENITVKLQFAEDGKPLAELLADHLIRQKACTT
jgi:hypothetical protein